VLKDINIEFPTGMSVGILGINGAGKSTLLRLIAGMDSPDKGKVTRYCSVSWPIGLGGGLQPKMTGRQNVKFVARVHGVVEDEIDRIIHYVEDFSEIGDAFDKPVRTYSRGMRSRLNFGLSLAFDFEVYLSDEATAVGDRVFRRKAKKAFHERVGQSSLIIVSHQEGILKDLCQAGVLLSQGGSTWYNDINDAMNAYHELTDQVRANGKK
jgi:capsular polysaccharide transport system ATP-binding protein